MSTFNSLEEAREYFKGDTFATENGMVIEELRDDFCCCSMTLNGNHKNANGGIMGGVIFTLGDFAFAVLSNQIHRPTVAQQVSINFLGAPKGEKLFSKAVLKKTGRTSTVINVDITDENGRDVAQFIGSGFKL
ncbi:MAG: PaaI family thioesterase [Lachnospiraceae bacterium]|nr:PaaI family thioesterase [Lachnospiraceae bacterium]